MQFVLYGTDFHHKEGEFSPRLSFDFYFLGYFRTDFLYESEGCLIEGKAGDVIIHAPGDIVYHGPRKGAKEGFRNDWVYIRGDDFGRLLEKYPLPIGRAFHSDSSSSLSGLFSLFESELSSGKAGSGDICSMAMSRLIIELYREIIDPVSNSICAKLEYARGKMLGSIASPWTVDSLAALIGYSKSRFLALYRRCFSASPMAELISARIEKAKLLLAYSRLTVGEIAESVGFSSLYYFSKYFKRACGVAPLTYRAKL